MMRHLLPSQVSITAEDPLDLVERERDYQHLLTGPGKLLQNLVR